jgi:hypothetical protein
MFDGYTAVNSRGVPKVALQFSVETEFRSKIKAVIRAFGTVGMVCFVICDALNPDFGNVQLYHYIVALHCNQN